MRGSSSSLTIPWMANLLETLRDSRDEFGEIVKGHPLVGLKGIEKVFYLLELRFFVQHPQLLSGIQSLPRA